MRIGTKVWVGQATLAIVGITSQHTREQRTGTVIATDNGTAMSIVRFKDGTELEIANEFLHIINGDQTVEETN